MGLTDLEVQLLDACRIALRQLEYDGDDKTAFAGAAFDALTKAIAAAEAKRGTPPTTFTAQFGNEDENA